MSDYIYCDGELMHYGVLGMKWGVRRNRKASNGTTTRKLSRRQKKKMQKAAAEARRKKMSIEERKAEILKSRSAKDLYKNADLFTTQELQNAYNRLVLEKNISTLAPKEVSRGKKFVDGFTSVGNNAHNVFDTGSKLYNDAARVYNTFFKGDNQPWPIIKDNDGKKKDK